MRHFSLTVNWFASVTFFVCRNKPKTKEKKEALKILTCHSWDCLEIWCRKNRTLPDAVHSIEQETMRTTLQKNRTLPDAVHSIGHKSRRATLPGTSWQSRRTGTIQNRYSRWTWNRRRSELGFRLPLETDLPWSELGFRPTSGNQSAVFIY